MSHYISRKLPTISGLLNEDEISNMRKYTKLERIFYTQLF